MACSGAMNEGVPSAVPARVASPPDSRMRATPKSSNFTALSRVMKTFAGLMSRWTIDCAWKAARVSQSSAAIHSASSTGTFRAIRFQSCWAVSPSSSSMTRKGSPASVTPSSSMATRPRWSTLLATYPSFKNRPVMPSSRANSAWRILSALRVPFRWVHAYTDAIPPTPSSASTWYLPLMVRPTRARARAFSSPASPAGGWDGGRSDIAAREVIAGRTRTVALSRPRLVPFSIPAERAEGAPEGA